MTTAFSIYFALNIVLAIGMHLGTLRSTQERPKPIEFAIFFLVFLFFGIPAVLIAIAVGARNLNNQVAEEGSYQIAHTTHASGIHTAHR